MSISTITQTITPFSGVFPQRNNYTSSNAYAQAVETWLTEEQAFQTELITVRSQLNTTIGEINTGINQVNADMQTTVEAKDAALAGSNYKGDWVSTTTYTQPASVTYNGAFYALKVASDIGSTPSTSSSIWQLLPHSGLEVPNISAPLSAYMGDTITVTMSNYVSGFTYSWTNLNSVVDNADGTFTGVLPDVATDTSWTIEVVASKEGFIAFASGTHVMTNKFINYTETYELLIDSTNINDTNFPTRDGVVTTGGKLTADGTGTGALGRGVAVSADVTDETVGTVFKRVDDGNVVVHKSTFELANINDGANINDEVISSVAIADGDSLVVVKDDLSTIVEYSNISSVSTLVGITARYFKFVIPLANRQLNEFRVKSKGVVIPISSVNGVGKTQGAYANTIDGDIGTGAYGTNLAIIFDLGAIHSEIDAFSMVDNYDNYTAGKITQFKVYASTSPMTLDTSAEGLLWADETITDEKVPNYREYDKSMFKQYKYTLNPTISEIPSRVFLNSNTIEYKIDDTTGYKEALKQSDTHSYDSATDIVTTTRVHNKVSDNSGSTTLNTRVTLPKGNSLTFHNAALFEGA